jgi:two-component system CheB/CheR fusion protein
VIESLAVRERRVTDKQGHHYSLRVRPYRTSDNKIDGAVITLVDIDVKEQANDSSRAKRTKKNSPRK